MSPSVVGKLIAEMSSSKPESVRDLEDAEVVARCTGSVAFAGALKVPVPGMLLLTPSGITAGSDTVRPPHDDVVIST